jgi:hypothetical protein
MLQSQVDYARSKGIEVGGYDLICLDRGHGQIYSRLGGMGSLGLQRHMILILILGVLGLICWTVVTATYIIY